MQDTERKKLFATAFLNPDMSIGNPLYFFNKLLSRKRFGQTSQMSWQINDRQVSAAPTRSYRTRASLI